jgi:hypothetical protein
MAFVEGRVSVELHTVLSDGFGSQRFVQRTIETATLRPNARQGR